MVSQGDIYDIVQDNIGDPAFGMASFLFAHRFSRSKLRGNLQIRFSTAGAIDEFTNTLLNETAIETVEWSSSGPKLYISDSDWSYPSSFEMDDVSEALDQVLLNAYIDILVKDRTDELLEILSRGGISRTARIIAALVYQRSHTRDSSDIDSSFIWNAYNLIETEQYERMARNNVLNELVAIGCIVRDGSDILPLPEFRSIETPEEYLPLPRVPDEWDG
jgi:hypothetical protein